MKILQLTCTIRCEKFTVTFTSTIWFAFSMTTAIGCRFTCNYKRLKKNRRCYFNFKCMHDIFRTIHNKIAKLIYLSSQLHNSCHCIHMSHRRHRCHDYCILQYCCKKLSRYIERNANIICFLYIHHHSHIVCFRAKCHFKESLQIHVIRR